MKRAERRWFTGGDGIAACWRPSWARSTLTICDGVRAWELDEADQPVAEAAGPRVDRAAWILRRGVWTLDCEWRDLRDRRGRPGVLRARLRLRSPDSVRTVALFVAAGLERSRSRGLGAEEFDRTFLADWIGSLAEGSMAQCVGQRQWEEVLGAGALGLDAVVFGCGLELAGPPAWRIDVEAGGRREAHAPSPRETRRPHGESRGERLSEGGADRSAPPRGVAEAKARRGAQPRVAAAGPQSGPRPGVGVRSVPARGPNPTASPDLVAANRDEVWFGWDHSTRGRRWIDWHRVRLPRPIGAVSAVEFAPGSVLVAGARGILAWDVIRGTHQLYGVPPSTPYDAGASALVTVGRHLFAATPRFGVWTWPHPAEARRVAHGDSPGALPLLLARDAEGVVYFGSGRRVQRLDPTQRSAAVDFGPLLPASVSAVHVDSDTIWVGTLDGRLLTGDGAAWRVQGQFATRVQSIRRWREHVVVATRDASARVYRPGSPSIDVPLPTAVRQLRESANHELWALSDDGRQLVAFTPDDPRRPHRWALPFVAESFAAQPPTNSFRVEKGNV